MVSPAWFVFRTRRKLPDAAPILLRLLLLLLGATLLVVPFGLGLLAGTGWKAGHVINIRLVIPAAKRLTDAHGLRRRKALGNGWQKSKSGLWTLRGGGVDAEARFEELVAVGKRWRSLFEVSS